METKEPRATEDILAERGKRYGKFEDHALITQSLKEVIRGYLVHKKLPYDQQEALDMICHKIGRIINGDHDYADSWDDIAGYAKLVANRLHEEFHANRKSTTDNTQETRIQRRQLNTRDTGKTEGGPTSERRPR